MSGSYHYGLRSRFYGLFSQLPWSLVVTAIVLLPVAYTATPDTRILLVHLTIYWALTASILMLVKDLYAQRYLFEFSVQRCGISVRKNKGTIVEYGWEQLKVIRALKKSHRLTRGVMDGNGLLLKFDYGFELPVYEQVSNYDQFNVILNRLTDRVNRLT